MLFSNLFNSPYVSYQVDIHSHLLPGLDDGVSTMEESISILKIFHNDLGFRKVVTTPHIMKDYYPNSEETILKTLEEVKSALQKENISVDLQAAAEYYFDENLLEKINTNHKLLLIDGKYLLFETNFFNEPPQLQEFIFLAQTKGLKPILAHPERYLYVQQSPSLLEDLRNRGVLFQINLPSLTGYYSSSAKNIAESLIKNKWCDFVGSDCHNHNQLELLKKAVKSKSYSRVVNESSLLNTSL